MILLRILFLPLRLIYFLWCRLRLLFRGGDTILHRVPDRFTMSRPGGWLAYLMPRQETHFIEYLAGLKIIAESPRIKTMGIIVPEMMASSVEIEEIIRRLDEIRASGTRVTAFAENGNLKTIQLMAAADARYVGLHSDFQVTFPSAEPFFVKDALRRMGVKVDSYTAGKYKSAAEMFTRTSFSPPARTAMRELLVDLRAAIETRLKATPGMEPGTLKKLIPALKNNAILSGADLVSLGFATEEVEASRFGERALGLPAAAPLTPHAFARENQHDRTQADATAAPAPEKPGKKSKKKRDKKKTGPRLTDEAAVFHRYRRERFRAVRLRRPASLALVAMEGSIVMGRPGMPPQGGNIEAQAFRDTFKQLENTRDEAVLVYINSPGGSAAASELLYQSIRSLAEVKPVFALLGPVAASGGYYIAAACDRIFAEASSITGSIGVISMRPNLKGLYTKLGVKKERIAFDKTRDLLSEAGPLSPASLKLLKDHMRVSYDLFLKRVADGRGLRRKAVLDSAEGRVWTGRQFVERGLVDEIGDIFNVLDVYKQTLGYSKDKEFQLNFYPEAKTDVRTVLEERMPGIPGIARLLGRRTRTGNPATPSLLDLAGSLVQGELSLLGGSEPLYYLPARLMLRGLL